MLYVLREVSLCWFWASGNMRSLGSFHVSHYLVFRRIIQQSQSQHNLSTCDQSNRAFIFPYSVF